MGKTIVEKILSRAASEDAYAGDIVNASNRRLSFIGGLESLRL